MLRVHSPAPELQQQPERQSRASKQGRRFVSLGWQSPAMHLRPCTQSAVVVQAVSPPQTLGVPSAPQIAGAVQLPQSSVPPQPSEIMPHSALSALQVVGTQSHTLGVPPPPHVSGATQDPQSSGCGHVPFAMLPHSAPSSAQVAGVQHTPNGLDPGGAPLTHAPLQQL